MTAALSQAIQDKITEHMPAMVAGELKQFIATAQERERELENARLRIKQLEEQIQTKDAKLSEHRELDRKLQEIETRERELAAAQLQVRYDQAANRASVAEGKLDILQDMMKTVFRNTEVRRSVLETVPMVVDGMPPNGSYPGSPGSPTMVQTHQKSSTVTESQA